MHKQNKYDALFSELKHEIQFDSQKKRQTLALLKTTIPANQRKLKKGKSFAPFIISITSIVVAACFMLLLLNDTDKPNVANQPNEPTNLEIDQNPPLTEGHTIFDVENFGKEHLQLKKDIPALLSNVYLAESDVFDTVKIDENGVAIVNFTGAFVDKFNNMMGSAGTGELMRALNEYAFSYDEIQTVYYLLDGDATAWTKWLQAVDEPITREEYEKYSSNAPSFEEIFSIEEEKFYLYGVTINDSKETIIAILGNDYTEEFDLEIGGNGNFDRIIYEGKNLTLLFIQDKLVSAFVEIHDAQEFDDFFESFTGNKFSNIFDEKQTSVENSKIIYSEESLHMVTAVYDPLEALTLALGTATPEAISNWKNGIIE